MEIENNGSVILSVVNRKKQLHLRTILSRSYYKNTFTISAIAKEIHTSIPSATVFINELIEKNWLKEVEAKATASGRRPSVYELNADKRHFLIIDINIRTITFYYINLTHVVKTKKIVNISINEENFGLRLMDEIQPIVQEFGSPWAIGLSSPGLIDKITKNNLTYVNHSVNGHSLTEWLSDELHTPTFLLNDTRASLFGEYCFGYVKKEKNAVLLNLDWGVGLGILSNGKIVEGADGFSGELGHIQVKPGGKLCHCGKIGCLDTVASASSILSTISEGLANQEQSLLRERQQPITIDDVVYAVNRGDSFAIRVVTDVAEEIGKGLAIVVHLLNPHVVIIDGVLSKMGDLMTSTISQALNKYCINDFKKELDIVISPLGELSKVYGTSAYVFDKMINR